MYYPQTANSLQRNKRIRRAILVVALLVVCLFLFVRPQVSHLLREAGAASLQESILKTAMQAAAVDGAYPATLAELEENYGLVVNHNDYIITYECFASNVTPSVIVVPR